jgi:HAD superfamily hydrolase (TIGR01484 family)
MKPFSDFFISEINPVRYVLTDIDDTLTLSGRLPSIALVAMEKLQSAGIAVIPITGRPAGWCDHIARMWPVDGVVGENGAFYFRYDIASRKMIRRYWKPEKARRADRNRLDAIQNRVLKAVPGARVASDQPYREADLAIDFCEDVVPLSPADIDRIVACFTEAGAQAKISSIHVNGWFGDYDKLAMTRQFFEEIFSQNLDAIKNQVIYVGDSPNDAPMFGYFPHSVGVANVKNFSGKIPHDPAWITEREGGLGFAEMAGRLIWMLHGLDQGFDELLQGG